MLLAIIFLLIIIIAIISAEAKLYVRISKNKISLILKFYIFKKILIGKINFKNRKIKKAKNRDINKFKSNKKAAFKFFYNSIKESHLNLDKLNLKIDVCTTDPILTSYFVMIISNIITLILKKTNLIIDYKNCKYIINPYYIDKKILNIKLNCIIRSNIVHIIYIFYRNFRKWRCDINERRAPNRKSYDNCNE